MGQKGLLINNSHCWAVSVGSSNGHTAFVSMQALFLEDSKFLCKGPSSANLEILCPLQLWFLDPDPNNQWGVQFLSICSEPRLWPRYENITDWHVVNIMLENHICPAGESYGLWMSGFWYWFIRRYFIAASVTQPQTIFLRSVPFPFVQKLASVRVCQQSRAQKAHHLKKMFSQYIGVGIWCIESKNAHH